MLALVLTAGGRARAGGSDPAGAEALFRAGREAMKRGDAPTACARLAESHRLEPAPGTLLNMAECEEAQGKVASAWAHLREAIDGLPANDDRLADAKKKALELEARLPRIVIRLASGAPPSSRVTRDGREVGAASFGVAIPVDPGTHTVLVAAPGRVDRRYDVVTAEGAETVLVADAGVVATAGASGGPLGSADPGTRERERDREESGGSRAPGWILLGASLVGVGLGSVTGVLAIDRDGTMNDHCDAARLCDGTGVAAASEGRTFDVVSTVSFVAAGVLAGAGLYWLFTHPTAAKATPR